MARENIGLLFYEHKGFFIAVHSLCDGKDLLRGRSFANIPISATAICHNAVLATGNVRQLSRIEILKFQNRIV